jgi:hypothetical protein
MKASTDLQNEAHAGRHLHTHTHADMHTNTTRQHKRLLMVLQGFRTYQLCRRVQQMREIAHEARRFECFSHHIVSPSLFVADFGGSAALLVRRNKSRRNTQGVAAPFGMYVLSSFEELPPLGAFVGSHPQIAWAND